MSDRYIPRVDHDRRHQPGPDALRYWNESFWFPLYDPKEDIGIVFRSGAFPIVGEANIYLFILHKGEIVFSLSDQHAPMAPMAPDRLQMDNGLSIEWREALHSFRLRFEHGAHGFDLEWHGMSPPFLYPHPEEISAELMPHHLEQGGHASGTVRIAGVEYAFDGLAHRDHTYGGDRDWDKFYRWTYLSGEFGRDRWFNAVRVKFAPDMDWIRVGCLWDGNQLLNLQHVEMHVETTDGGTRQTAVGAWITDETGATHYIHSERVLGVAPVRIWRTWLRDAFVRYRWGEHVGYGILEHGYVEDP